MSDFQTMDDFAVFVNDYLTPNQLGVQDIHASDQQSSSLLVTIDDYEDVSLACCLTFSGLHQAFFQSVMDTDKHLSIDSDSWL
ncbi:MAG: hypothetical protein ACLS36_09110 [Streptococcus sp.]